VICDAGDVVTVPFPFTDKVAQKRRPALVLSRNSFNRQGHSLMTMITSSLRQPWPDDSPIRDLTASGLSKPCVVRLKLFTLDNRLMVRRIGHLAEEDRQAVAEALKSILGI